MPDPSSESPSEPKPKSSPIPATSLIPIAYRHRSLPATSGEVRLYLSAIVSYWRDAKHNVRLGTLLRVEQDEEQDDEAKPIFKHPKPSDPALPPIRLSDDKWSAMNLLRSDLWALLAPGLPQRDHSGVLIVDQAYIFSACPDLGVARFFAFIDGIATLGDETRHALLMRPLEDILAKALLELDRA